MSWAPQSNPLELGDHFCVLTTSAEQRMAAIIQVVAHGLTDGQLVMVLTESASPSAVADVLTERISAATEGLASGQLRVLPAREAYLKNGQFNPGVYEAMAAGIGEALAAGYSGLQVAADMTWALSTSVNTADLVDYEAAVNALALDGYASGACLYDRHGMDVGLLRAIIQAHPATTQRLPATPALRIRRTHRPYGIALIGEADISNRHAVQRALEATVGGLPDSHSPLVVDVTGLQFADAAVGAALRALVRRVPGGVRLVGCHGAVAVLFQHLDMNHTPGIELHMAPAPRARTDQTPTGRWPADTSSAL